MKRLALILAILTILASPVLALDPNWNGDPEPPTVDPEPPSVTPPTDFSPPVESWVDRHGSLPMSQPLPCCVRDGQLVTTPFLFMSHERALKVCERAKATGAALIYECAGAVSPEAVK